MWVLQTTVALILLFCSITALPVGEDEAANRGLFDNNNVNSDVIDLSRLGPKTFGYPNDESGKSVEERNASSVMNPEETGKHGEGDILMAGTDPLGRKGMREFLRWPDGVIPYVIEADFDPVQRKLIMRAIDEYHRLTCLRFVPYRGQTDYIAIESSQNGCFSTIGRVGGRQVVNLQIPDCVVKLGTVIHELLHAAGFMHEHRRPDRDDYITINLNNVEPKFYDNFSKSGEADIIDYGVPYDYDSVMHYSAYAFSKNHQKTIEAKREKSFQRSSMRLGQRTGFSPGDIRKVNSMYNHCKKGASLASRQRAPGAGEVEFFGFGSKDRACIHNNMSAESC